MRINRQATLTFTTVGRPYSRATIEPVGSDIQAPDVLQETTQSGALAGLSLFFPYNDRTGIEVSGRYSTFDDDDQFENSGDVQIVHAGATWREVMPALDVGITYVHRAETDEVPNDTIRLQFQAIPAIDLARR